MTDFEIHPKSLEVWVCVGDHVYMLSDPNITNTMSKRDVRIAKAMLKDAKENLDEWRDDTWGL